MTNLKSSSWGCKKTSEHWSFFSPFYWLPKTDEQSFIALASSDLKGSSHQVSRKQPTSGSYPGSMFCSTHFLPRASEEGLLRNHNLGYEMQQLIILPSLDLLLPCARCSCISHCLVSVIRKEKIKGVGTQFLTRVLVIGFSTLSANFGNFSLKFWHAAWPTL